jgi:hypothetical protein
MNRKSGYGLRSWRALAGGALASLLAMLLPWATAGPAAAATGYSTPGYGEIHVDATCHTNSYAGNVPPLIAVDASARIEQNRTAEWVFIRLWFHRLQSNTWEHVDGGWLRLDATANTYQFNNYSYHPTYVHGSFEVWATVYYQQIDGSTPSWNLYDDWYQNAWNGLPRADTRGSCTI